jgi:hypothetical protein
MNMHTAWQPFLKMPADNGTFSWLVRLFLKQQTFFNELPPCLAMCRSGNCRETRSQ